jgi:hypothetical protein
VETEAKPIRSRSPAFFNIPFNVGSEALQIISFVHSSVHGNDKKEGKGNGRRNISCMLVREGSGQAVMVMVCIMHREYVPCCPSCTLPSKNSLDPSLSLPPYTSLPLTLALPVLSPHFFRKKNDMYILQRQAVVVCQTPASHSHPCIPSGEGKSKALELRRFCLPENSRG